MRDHPLDVFGQQEAILHQAVNGSIPSLLVSCVIDIEPGELPVIEGDHLTQGWTTSAAGKVLGTRRIEPRHPHAPDRVPVLVTHHAIDRGRVPGDARDVSHGETVSDPTVDPMLDLDDTAMTGEPDPAWAGGTLLGKRYGSEELGLEVLCTKPGAGTLSVGGNALESARAKPLPASD